MDTVGAIIVSQVPIGIGAIIAAYELRRIRKSLERILKEK